MEPQNNGHSGDRVLVHCREVVPISEGTECMLQSVGGKQFVRFMEVIRFSECPLSFHCSTCIPAAFYCSSTCTLIHVYIHVQYM